MKRNKQNPLNSLKELHKKLDDFEFWSSLIERQQNAEDKKIITNLIYRMVSAEESLNSGI